MIELFWANNEHLNILPHRLNVFCQMLVKVYVGDSVVFCPVQKLVILEILQSQLDLLCQSQQWKHQTNVQNLFKVNK